MQVRDWVLAVCSVGSLALSGCGASGEPYLADVEPRRGPQNGDQPVRIKGANLRTDIGYTVYFGKEKSDQVFIEGPEALVAVAPQADEPGPVDLVVQADDGTAWRIKGAFEYSGGGSAPAQGEGAGAAPAKKLAY